MSVSGWSTDSTSTYIPDELRDSNGALINTGGGIDAEYAELLLGQPTSLTADFGSAFTFRDALVFGLGVTQLRDATITLESSVNGVSYTVIDTYSGERNFENWVYMGTSGSFNARYLRLTVDGRNGAQPHFLFIDEIVVRY